MVFIYPKTSGSSLYKGFAWTLILTVIVLLSKRSKPEVVRYEGITNFSSIRISSELVSISGRLGLVWSSTRDNVLRKYNLPLKSTHRYGIQFDIKTNKLHLFLCILLAGDIATNPGPSIIPNTNVCLLNSNTDMVMHFNCRSLLPKVDELRTAIYEIG